MTMTVKKYAFKIKHFEKPSNDKNIVISLTVKIMP